MKKVLFFFALLGCMIAAQAQADFQLVHNATAYNNNDTISIDVLEEDIYEMDYQVLVFLQVQNNTSNDVEMTLTTHMLSGTNAYRVQSVCSTICAEGETCPPFTTAANSQSDNVFPEYIVTPSAATEGTVGVAELIVNQTSDNAQLTRALLKMTYHPMNNSIASAQAVKVKVYPNPTTSMLNIDSENADEISLTDLNGKTIMRQRVNGNAQLNVEGLANGIYMLNTIKGGQITGSQKVVVR